MARCFLLLIGMSVNGENIFAGAYVDRHGHVRTDPDWLSAAIQSDASWFVPVWGTRCLTDGEPPSLVLLQRQNIDDIQRAVRSGPVVLANPARRRRSNTK